MIAALFATCIMTAPAVASDDAAQLQAIREENAAMKQELLQINKTLGRIQQALDDMPKSYVPRAEHDLRDHQLDMVRADIERRVATTEAAVKAQNDRQFEWLWDLLKMSVPALMAGGGVGFAARIWRNKEIHEEEHKRRRAENTVGFMKEIIRKTKKSLAEKGVADVPLPDFDS